MMRYFLHKMPITFTFLGRKKLEVVPGAESGALAFLTNTSIWSSCIPYKPFNLELLNSLQTLQSGALAFLINPSIWSSCIPYKPFNLELLHSLQTLQSGALAFLTNPSDSSARKWYMKVMSWILQGPFNKYWDWFAVSSMEQWMGVRLGSSVERSPTTHAHLSSVASSHALRQEVEFCGVVMPATLRCEDLL